MDSETSQCFFKGNKPYAEIFISRQQKAEEGVHM